MIITGNQLLGLINSGIINANPNNVNASSIDVTLSDLIMVEDVLSSGIVNISNGDSPNYERITLSKEGMIIQPGQCFLASTNEYLRLPDDISAEFITRSSIGRCFLEHMKSGWIDAGFNGQITLELKNMLQAHELLITPNLRIGQIIFHKHKIVSRDFSYATKGHYNGQVGPTMAYKGEVVNVTA